MGVPLSGILDGSDPSQKAYKCYEQSLTALTSPININVQADLGRPAINGYVYNTSSNSFKLNISVNNGVTFGDDITVYPASAFSLGTVWVKTTNIRLTRGSGDAPFQAVVV